MHDVRTDNARVISTTRSKISNRSQLLPGVDGRSATARRFRDLITAFSDEMGGDLAETEQALVRQAALLTLRIENAGLDVDGDSLVRLSSEARRCLVAIRSKAEKTKPTGPNLLQQYLAANYGAGDDAEPETAGAEGDA